ncbi:hypothetical protein [Pelagibacterium limicola]|uniref:hypothetical protein n=1 Tax=Pelagibacterium limicola TaxID=2791022 RepID=UPI0018AFDB19|nr:hypothetical protein [Pelagibacterium limicola]
MLCTTRRAGSDLINAARAIALAFFACLALAFPATAQDRVTVEVQRHENYGRIIVTFQDRLSLPEHEVSIENGVLVIQFGVRLAGVLPEIARALDDVISVARFDPDMTGIRMGLRGPMQLNTIDAGEQLFIDLLPPNWVGLPPSLPPETVARLARRAEDAARLAEERRRAELAAEYNPAAVVRVGRHPTFWRIMFNWNVGTRASYAREEDSASITFDWPVGIDLYEIISDMPEQLLAVENTVSLGGTTVTLNVEQGTRMRFYEDSATRFILDIDLAGVFVEAIDPEALARASAGVEGSGTAEAAHSDSSDPDGAIAASGEEPDTVVPFVTTVGSTVRVVFPFHRETPAAVFRRGDTLWLVFDTPAEIAPPMDEYSSGSLDALVSDFAVEGFEGSKVVRLELSQDRLATMGSEGRAWVLSLGDVLISATQPIMLERRQGAGGLFEVFADVGQPGRVHTLRDPNVGDTLEVVTAFPPARGIVRDLHYVDFSAPRTVHGLVFRPNHDGVSVRVEGNRAVVAAEAGLTLSAEQPIRLAASGIDAQNLVDLGVHIAANPADLQQRRIELVGRTLSAEGRDLDRARLDLATFYLANNLAFESLGVLSTLRASLRQPDLESAIRIVEGAANAVAGRAREAVSLLGTEALAESSEARFWRTIARAQLGDWEGARMEALGSELLASNQPNWIRSRYLLAGIRAAVEREDIALATRFLQQIDLSAMGPDQISEFDLLSGMLDELNGRYPEALESYGRVIAADRRPTTSQAVLRTISLLDELGRLDVARAADTLAVQSVIWRGDSTELAIIEKLTDLQYRNGNYRDAFSTTRLVSDSHRNSDVLSRLMERAQVEFQALYIDGRADALDAIEALSIYYDFRQLTPAGTQGDQMIRNLAHRLIRVDLLNQAAELLDYQVNNRLQGAARSQVAADLAIIHIANREPAKALEALYRTRLSGLPPALERQRRVLEARALLDVGRFDLALDMLAGMAGRDIDLLRVDAYWRAKRYREAAETIERLYAVDLDKGTLSPIARTNIVKAAVGYLMANDQIGLSRLRNRYSDLMSRAPEWPMFSFVTDAIDTSASEFRQIARQIAAVDSLNAFLNAYREIYTSEGAITPFRATRQDGIS